MKTKLLLTLVCCVFFFARGSSQSFDELNSEAVSLTLAGKYQEAIAVALRSIDAAVLEKGTVSFEHLTALKNTAYLYGVVSSHDLSAQYYEKAIPVSEKLYGPEHYLHLDVMYSLIVAYTKAGNQQKGDELAAVYNLHYRSITKANQLNNDAAAAMEKGDYATAESLLLQALPIMIRHFGENHNYTITVLLQLGHTAKQTARYRDAELYFTRAINGYEAMSEDEERPYYTATIQHLGELYKETGRYEQAEAQYLEAIAIDKKLEGEDNPGFAANLHTLAHFYKTMGRYAEAEKLLLQAQSILSINPGEEDMLFATSLMYLADLYVGMGQYGKAEQPATRALAIGRLLPSTDNKIQLLSNVASLYTTMGNYAAAIQLFDEGLQLCSAGETNFMQHIVILNNAGKLLESLEEYERADTLYSQALGIMDNTIGNAHPDYAATLVNLAGIAIHHKQYVRAEQQLLQAKEIFNTASGEADENYHRILTSFGILYQLQGKNKLAEDNLMQVVNMVKKTKGTTHPDYADALINLALLKWQHNDLATAGNLYTQASQLLLNHIAGNILFLNESEKLQLWNTQSGVFDALLSLVRQTPGPSRQLLHNVYTQQLQIKGLVLSDAARALAQARESADTDVAVLLSNWKALKATFLKETLLPEQQRRFDTDSLLYAINTTEKKINQRSAVLRNIHVAPVTGAAVQQQLSDDEASIEFVHFDYYDKNRWTDTVMYGAFITTKRDSVPVFITLCNEAQLSRLLEYDNTASSETYATNLYRSLTIKGTKQNTYKGDSLYKLLWQPLESYLQDITRISIAPSGLLNRIAFIALPTKTNEYLGDKYTLRQFTSTRHRVDVADETVNIKDILLYGGINYGNSSSSEVATSNGSFKYLPGTLTEVEKIGSLFHKTKTDLRTGDAATEEYFKSRSGTAPAIIHLATHGYVLADPEKKKNDNVTEQGRYSNTGDAMLRSGLILARGNNGWNASVTTKEDGVLTAYEIAQLDLGQSQLAVLSACETALGDIRGTEGVYGLQRAFKMAGVKKLVSSLWQVPDKETAELMQYFYTGLLNNKPVHQAFTDAQKQMRKKYPPYYWAAFILVE